MNHNATLSDRIAGAIVFGLGLVAIVEAFRLYPMRLRASVGDHTLPALLGVLLVAMGLWLFFGARSDLSTVAVFPTDMRKTILTVLTILVAYLGLIMLVGYILSTFLAALGLFRTIGCYRWNRCLIFSLILTLVFYVFFIAWLDTPFPSGIGIFGEG